MHTHTISDYIYIHKHTNTHICIFPSILEHHFMSLGYICMCSQCYVYMCVNLCVYVLYVPEYLCFFPS